MQISVYADPRSITEAQMHNRTVIVIDVLRATTTITTAIENGANQVIPAEDPGEAMAFFGRLGRDGNILAGERGGLKLPDFHLGNSPLEFTREAVEDQTVIIATTNGTRAILAARNASALLIGCMRNRAAVAKKAVEKGNDIILLCAGTEGMFSADDICCAGAIVQSLSGLVEGAAYDDLARICCLLYFDWKNKKVDLSDTFHYARLKKLGFDEDLVFCFDEDKTDCVACYKNGVIIRA